MFRSHRRPRARPSRHDLPRPGPRRLRRRRDAPPAGRKALQRHRPTDERQQPRAARRRTPDRRQAWPADARRAREAVSRRSRSPCGDQGSARDAAGVDVHVDARDTSRPRGSARQELARALVSAEDRSAQPRARRSRRPDQVPPPGSRGARAWNVSARGERGEPAGAHPSRRAGSAARLAGARRRRHFAAHCRECQRRRARQRSRSRR